MTTDTIAGYLYMIKFPAQRNMAGIADITTRDMSGILSLCDNIVVATRAATVHGGMINPDNVAP
jgi:ribosomal silencing factor RsfS